MMAEPLWKKVERSIAGLLGGERVPITGRGDLPDVVAGPLAVEVKEREKLPEWIQQAMAQAATGAGVLFRQTQRNRVPVVVLHQKGQGHSGDCVVLMLEDFIGILEGCTYDYDTGQWVRVPAGLRRGAQFRFDRDNRVGIWEPCAAPAEGFPDAERLS